MNDTTRRFLDAVLERVPESRIVEVRLFPAIRQGGVESGIAVLAVNPEPPLPFPDASAVLAGEGTESLFGTIEESDRGGGETPVGLIAVDDDRPEPDFSPEDNESMTADGADVFPTVVPARQIAASVEPQPGVVSPVIHRRDDRTSEFEIGLEGIADAPTQEIPAVHEQPSGELPVDLVPVMSDTAPAPDAEDDIALGDILSLPARPTTVAGPDRLAILCARYKLIVKGADRGKWDIEIVHQADAPIDTLDLVIKGVIRRSGDDAVPERFTRQSLRDLLDAPAWATDI